MTGGHVGYQTQIRLSSSACFIYESFHLLASVGEIATVREADPDCWYSAKGGFL
jgi:hypothetical protein